MSEHTRAIVEKFGATPGNTLWDFAQSVFDAIKDGDLDTEDYPNVVLSAQKAFDELTPQLDIPRVPEIVENSVVFPLVRLLIPGGVKLVYSVLRIPLPETV